MPRKINCFIIKCFLYIKFEIIRLCSEFAFYVCLNTIVALFKFWALFRYWELNFLV